jgi:hypothetical protein
MEPIIDNVKIYNTFEKKLQAAMRNLIIKRMGSDEPIRLRKRFGERPPDRVLKTLLEFVDSKTFTMM